MNVATQIRNLTQKIPANHLGLPEGIYRPDLLPMFPTQPQVQALLVPSAQDTVDTNNIDSDIIEHTPQAPAESSAGLESTGFNAAQNLVLQQSLMVYEKEVKAAYVPLDYAEGYPTMDGMPFWSQLPFEPADAFRCFYAYLNLNKGGVRQLAALLDRPEILELPVEIRPGIKQLEEAFHTYYWNARVKAFDMFSAAYRRKEREKLAMETEDTHYGMAARLLAIFDEYITTNADELIETLTPKAALEMFKTAAQVQRMSVGLSANGNNSNQNDIPVGASLELIMRSISQSTRAADDSENQGKLEETRINNEENRGNLQKIMENPQMVKNAQELIIKLTQAQQPAERMF